jgi:hypothetical protein
MKKKDRPVHLGLQNGATQFLEPVAPCPDPLGHLEPGRIILESRMVDVDERNVLRDVSI